MWGDVLTPRPPEGGEKSTLGDLGVKLGIRN